MLKLIVLNCFLLIYCYNLVNGSGEGSNEENEMFFDAKDEFDISSEIDEIDQHVKNQIAWILKNASECDEQEKCDLLNAEIKNEDANTRLNLYIKCVDHFFTKDKGLFQMKNSKHLEFSEINKKLLRAFLLTKPLYISTIMYESIQKKNSNALLEIVSTQKLEDLNVAMKIMIALHPNLKLDNDKVDFNEFSKVQNVFDGEKLEKFLNWRFDPNCNEKPIEDKIGWLKGQIKKIQNYMKNPEQKCLENPTIGQYMEILESKNELNNFLLFRFDCTLKPFAKTNPTRNSFHMDTLMRSIILSYSVDGESITHLMKVNEKKELEDKINDAYFNLQGWNDKVFKYACKRFLNLDNASQVMSYNRFIEHYGENIIAFTNALTNVENLVDIKIESKKVKITNDKLFNELNKVPGSSILKDLIKGINDGILLQLGKLNTGKINEQKGNDLILFISNHLRAAYLALALALNHVVEKVDDNEIKVKVIILKISNVQLDKIKSVNFDSIKKLLDEISIKLSKQHSDFVNDLINEMINLINNIDFKCE
ncbi:unnamed protein product [Meloidogyne enterolobii]|uniref:Uncharacterized protein n=1 Tax=Meloidogyne enterolobii TaxID=390850 RepID=A0ACB1B829_MELEN